MQHQKNLSQSGFTLVEIMIVVLIVGILAAVAVPNYQESVIRSRRAEATATLQEAANWLQRQYTINNNFVDPDTSAPFATAKLQAIGLGQSPRSGTVRYNITLTNVTATGYTLNAVPVAADKCGTFRLDETGLRSVTGVAPMADCWDGK